jgi:hypothetical protein
MLREGAQDGVPGMSQALSFYERRSFYEEFSWWFVGERIGQGLREYYEVPRELPPKLLALVRKLAAVEDKHRLRRPVSILDAIEGKYLLRYATSVEPRSADPNDTDWPLCT